VASGGGEVRGKDLSDSCEDSEYDSSSTDRSLSPCPTRKIDTIEKSRFEQLPKYSPAILAPRGRPSDVHTLHGDDGNVLNQVSDKAPGKERPGSQAPYHLCIANLPQDRSGDQGELAPRGASGDLKAIYEAAGFISLRGVVRALVRLLCEEIASVSNQLELWQIEARVPEHKLRSIEVPETTSEALERICHALEEVVELRTMLDGVKVDSATRLQHVEIESCFKIQVM